MTADDLSALLAQVEGADDGARFGLANQVRAHPGLATSTGAEAFIAAALLADYGAVPDLPQAAALAQRAHEEGVERAGLLYAMCTDKLTLYSGRPQPYGTITVEHQGDVVQPPVDPATTDEERAALGVESLHQLQRAAEEASRERAVARAAEPAALPYGQPFARVWTNPTPDELRARAEAEGAAAWADGNILTFMTPSEVPVAVTPVFPVPSWEAGEGLQVLSLQVDRLDEAVITYTFTPLSGAPAMNFARGSHDGRFRGPNAPDELPSNDPLVGASYEAGIDSMALGDHRRITVYRPPQHVVGEAIPVVYATDGNMFSPYARRLDAAIEAGWCPRVVIVAAHSAPADQIQGNQRALEYLLGFDDRRFDAHQRFFVDELSKWAEAELGVPATREMRGVLGCSDGGGHAIATGRLHHQRFGHIFAFSTGTPPESTAQANPDPHPFVHLCAGTLELGFHGATAAWAGYLHQMGIDHHFTERVSGHDLIQWCEELPRALARAWGQPAPDAR